MSFLQVLSVFQERRIISDETARFEELLVRQRDFFVEEELKEKYRRLISFVQQTEATMTSGETGVLHKGVQHVIFWKRLRNSFPTNVLNSIHQAPKHLDQ